MGKPNLPCLILRESCIRLTANTKAQAKFKQTRQELTVGFRTTCLALKEFTPIPELILDGFHSCDRLFNSPSLITDLQINWRQTYKSLDVELITMV